MSEIKTDYEFLPEQRVYAENVKKINEGIFGFKPKACVVTYGCQQNVSDSERIKGILAVMGYDFTDDPEDAQFILFNTCAVREHAQDRVYGNVGATKKLKQKDKNIIIAVCGCMAQQESVAKKFKESFPYVDLVFGTQVQYKLPELLYKRLKGSRVFDLALENGDIVENIPVRRDGDIRGWLPVMNGCNNFCTYCIVPYVRGRERSRKPDEIIKEAKELVSLGFKEITLLGQNVNSYGKNLEDPIDFAELLYRINDIPGDFRIRFMTSHPKDCTLRLLDAMRDCEKVERHLHLPFQSGSDRILKAMNRRYDSKSYLNLISEARKRVPEMEFTSDIIVGFPGETYEDFKKTLELVEKVRFTSLFTFIYSPRENTPAAKLPDPVTREEKGKWFDELLKLQERISAEDIEKIIGSKKRVLFDEISKEGYLAGKSEGFLNIEVKADKNLLGTFKDVKIEEYKNGLKGSIIE